MSLRIALWRPALPGRVGMVLAVGLVAILARVAGAFAGGHWGASVHQASAVVLTNGVLVPIFIAMLGANLLRGEHASLSWLLARPSSRSSLIGSLVLLDVATILACVGLASIVLGALKPAWFALSEVTWAASLGGGYLATYLVAAIGGTRTASSIRAIVGGLAVLAVAAACLYGAFAGLYGNGLPGIDGRWILAVLDRGPFTVEALGWTDPRVLWAFATMVALVSIPIAIVMGFVRTARQVPGRIGWTALVGPLLSLWGVAALAGAIGAATVWFEAPSQAIDDDVELEIRWSVLDEDTSPRWTHLTYESFLGEIEPAPVRAGKGSLRGIVRRAARFEGLGAGRYRACADFDRPAPTPERPDRRAVYQRCIDLDLAPGERQSVTIEVGQDVPARLVRYD